MATLDDGLTAGKNLVIGVNNLTQTYKFINGTQTSGVITGTTLISAGSGRVVSYNVTVAGTTTGTIYNSTTTAGAASSNALAIIQQAVTTNAIQVGANFTNGLVVTPGAGQSVVVTYSLTVV